MPYRSANGSVIAEYMGVIVIILVVLTFPLINAATIAYRYNMMVAAAHAAAHAGAVAPSVTVAPTGMVQVVPKAVDAFLQNARGISNYNVRFRINTSNIATGNVNNGNWNAKLTSAADLDNMYSVQCVVTADVEPIAFMRTGFLPNIPGITAPQRFSVSAQEIAEKLNGLNR